MKPKFIKTYSDLITIDKATQAGFLQQALQKIEQSESFLKQAAQFKKKLKSVRSIDDLLKLKECKDDLLTCVGFSAKSLSHISQQERATLLSQALEAIHKKHGKKFKDAIFHRYLLIKGDSLGGIMRNLTGSQGQKILVDAILQALKNKGTVYKITSSEDSGKIQSIAWDKRCLVFDKTPKFIGKNIDVALIEIDLPKEIIGSKQKQNYIACGELKGGIDPAGADEHWKTARSSLERIRSAFSKESCPSLFFVAAAIETAMAKEIYEKLTSEELTFAANLTVREQINDLASWLISL